MAKLQTSEIFYFIKKSEFEMKQPRIVRYGLKNIPNAYEKKTENQLGEIRTKNKIFFFSNHLFIEKTTTSNNKGSFI